MPQHKGGRHRKPSTNAYQKAKYAAHYDRAKKNKLHRHKNHIRIHPNDKQALLALKTI